MSLSGDAELSKVRILGHGAEYSTGGGGTGRLTEFTAQRNRDRKNVRGVLAAQVFSDHWAASYGIAVYLRMAPAKQWRKLDRAARTVQDRITVLGNPPDWTFVR